MARIVITGAGGLLGSSLISELAKYNEYEILGLVRSGKSIPKSFNQNVKYQEVDVLDFLGLEEVFEVNDVVIHCAAIVSYDVKEVSKMLKVNELGTANVVSAAMNKEIKKLIHISSVATLTQKKNGEIINEQNIWSDHPEASQYAISKFKAEQEVWRGIHEGLNATILNPSFILGEGDFSKSSLRIINTVASNSLFYPRGSNGFVDIMDVTKAIIETVRNDYFGERFIISGANLSYKSLYQMLMKSLGRKFNSMPLPSYTDRFIVFADFLKSLLPGQKRVIWRDTVNATKQERTFDNKKSIKILGINYRPIEETITAMATKYLQQVHK